MEERINLTEVLNLAREYTLADIRFISFHEPEMTMLLRPDRRVRVTGLRSSDFKLILEAFEDTSSNPEAPDGQSF
jgi:hypothetical protein